MDWADESASLLSGVGLTGPVAARRRTLQAAARKILPELTPAEIVQALREGHGHHCHLDDAGRAVNPADTNRGGQP